MITNLSHVSIPVEDYDTALKWYTEKLGLEPRMDASFGPGFRFLTVGVPGQKDLEIVLVKKQPGGPEVPKPAGWVFHTDDCRQEVNRLRERGVQILKEPEELPFGTQAVFADLYGNAFALVQTR